jgi:predicted RNA binding protein YcfA (HicA-like mRNA interferase family)
MAKITSVSWKTLKCVFEKDRFTHIRTEGDHLVFTKPGVLRPIVIPKYQSIPVFIIKNNLRAAGISRERYFELLKRC